MFKRKKYPVVRQYEQSDCGPACLLSVLRYFGGEDSLVHIRELCRTSVQGSSLANMIKAAEKLGLQGRAVQGTYKQLCRQHMPCIAHIIMPDKMQHFIVIYKIAGDTLLVSDPAKGRIKMSSGIFSQLWQSKTVLLLQPRRQVFRAKNPRWYSWIMTSVKNEHNWICQSLFLGILYTLMGLLTAVFIQQLIDRFIPGAEMIKSCWTALSLFLVLLLRALAGYMRQRFSVELNKRISLYINKNFISHLFRLPKKFYDTRRTGDITARIHDAVRIQQSILHISAVTIIDLLVIVGSFLLIFYFSTLLAWIVLLIVPSYGLLTWFRSGLLKGEQLQVMKSYARVESAYIDSLRGINEIINYNTAPYFSRLNLALFRDYQDRIEKLGITRCGMVLYAELASAFIISTVLLSGAFLVLKSELMLGQMMACYSIISNILPAVNRLIEANMSLQGAAAAGQRLQDILLTEKENKKATQPFLFKDALHIRNGFFSWPGSRTLFNGINLTLKRGKLHALWGASGSGKSTLIQLIQRKYSFDSGTICIDNQNARSIDLQEYRKSIALVPQDINIFNGTLADNILCGRAAPAPQDMIHKINSLGFAAFLCRFKAGLYTLLGEDSRTLSGGEKQILALLRALWDKPQILIIDEGMSALDIRMESRIDTILKTYAGQHMVLLISHNLGTVLKADHICVLHQGHIIEEGHPHSLITKNGYFSSLWHIYNKNGSKSREYL